jgi:hypothetical protein
MPLLVLLKLKEGAWGRTIGSTGRNDQQARPRELSFYNHQFRLANF